MRNTNKGSPSALSATHFRSLPSSLAARVALARHTHSNAENPVPHSMVSSIGDPTVTPNSLAALPRFTTTS